jgi:hypothetical protein
MICYLVEKRLFNEDPAYAISRLSNSWVFQKDRKKGLRFIRDIRVNHLEPTFSASDLINSNEDLQPAKEIKGKDIDTCIGRIGYVNSVLPDREPSAMYISRLPIRRDYKQGLRASSLVFIKAMSSTSVGERWFNNNIKSISAAIRGEYPSLGEALDIIDDSYERDVAINRNFALTSRFKLAYKGAVVGAVSKDDRLKLDEEFKFLREELSKLVGVEKVVS